MRSLSPSILILAGLLLGAVPTLADEPAEPVAPAAPKAPEPPKVPSATEINRLIAQLGASDFAVRERASRELLRIGEPARKALERTMQESENMEARWRAEQILRRLDREGEKPVGRPGEPEAAPGLPPLPPEFERLRPGAGGRDMSKVLEEILRGGLRNRDPFGKPHVLEAPGLKLEIKMFGPLATLDLHVAGRLGYFFGRTLEDILRMHPELEKLEGMPALKEQWDAFKKENPRLFPFENMPFGFGSTFSNNGVTITQTPDGVKVVLRETDKDGNITENTYEGESLEEIRRKYPEIADKIKVTVRFGTLVLPPARRRLPNLPVPPASPPVTPPSTPREPPPARASFGVGLDPVEAVLAQHLQLEPGHGALVRSVEPKSLAQLIGIERHDVIVSIDERPVTSYQQAVDALRRAGRERVPVKLEVIRRGLRVTLPK